MAQVKLLKIATDGVVQEFGTTDDISLNSFTVTGGAQALSATGLVLGSQPVTGASSFQVTSPASGFLNQTAGNLIFDNIFGKERTNLLSTAGEILFPVVTDTPSTVDNFRVPQIAGAPTSTPTNAGSGYMVFDSTDNRLYVWSGSAWIDQTSIAYAPNVQNPYTAGAALAAHDVVYVSAADTVSQAVASAPASSQVIGFAVGAAALSAAVQVQENGILNGFTGLTAGARYYLSGTTAGAVTNTIPAASGNTIVQVGYAKSATALHISIDSLGRRA